MNREVHVRFWEGVGVKSSRATQLIRQDTFSFVGIPPHTGPLTSPVSTGSPAETMI